MNLIELKYHMQKVKIATLSNLSHTFNKEATVLRCMLSHWIRKGNIRLCTRKPACGSSCFKCPKATMEMYEWIDNPLPC